MDHKICTRCKKDKSIENFYRDKGNPTGYKSHCIDCIKEYTRSDKAREMLRRGAAKFRQTEKGKEYTKRYNQTEKAKQMKKDYKKTKAGKEAQKRYQRSERYKERMREYRKLHLEWERNGGIKYRNNSQNLDKMKARKAIWYAVKVGKLPKVFTLKCIECGNQATEYHHHNGYDKQHRLDVIPLCRICHESRHH